MLRHLPAYYLLNGSRALKPFCLFSVSSEVIRSVKVRKEKPAEYILKQLLPPKKNAQLTLALP